MSSSFSLREFFREAGRGWTAPVIIVIALALLVTGIFSPMVSMEKLFSDPKPYSAVSGIIEFFSSGDFALGIIVLLFSILFPTFKLGLLALIWFQQPYRKRSRTVYKWLEILGRWSMLDFFVVCIMLGAIQLGILADAHAHYGVYVFGSAILLSILATAWIRHVETEPRSARKSSWHPFGLNVVLVSLVGLLMLYRGVTHPVMKVEKWIFWKHDYSILQGIRELLAAHKTVLGVAFLLFVVLVPALKLLGIVVAYVVSRFRGVHSPVMQGLVLADTLAMVDVFGLALVVVLFKVSDMAHVTLQSGAWYLAATGVLSIYLSWEIQRSYRT